MNITLTPEEEAFIADKVNRGLYSSSTDVIRKALQLLAKKEAAMDEEQAQKRQTAQAILDSIQPIKLQRCSTDVIREERERLNNRP